jgi:sarcosine oxidase
MGLASAWALARAGRDVTVLEQYEVGHPLGSSHGESRIFRFAYDEPEWVALAQEALPLWRELEEESGTQLLSLTGLLDARRDSAPLLAALDACSAEYERLDAAEVARRYGIMLEDRVEGVLELHGGIVRADRALAAFSRGIPVETNVRVIELAAGDDGVALRTSQGEIEAGLAVVAAGGWATPLLADAGIDLETEVSQETVSYYRLPGVETLPSVIDWNFEAEGRGRGDAASLGPRRRRAANGGNEHTGRHAYSLAGGEGLLKVGLHHTGRKVDPGTPGEPDPDVVAGEAAWVASRFPAADPEPIRAETCLYTNIDDDRFVIERHGSIIDCSACSGHGFKFAPAVGTRVAALA